MTATNQQLSMWSNAPIVHVALSLKGGKFEPEDQPVKGLGDYKPGQRIRMVIEGRIDDKVTEDITEAGQVLFVSATITRAYDIDDEELAETLLENGHDAAVEAVRAKMAIPFVAVAS